MLFDRRQFIQTMLAALLSPLAGCRLENTMPLFDELLLKVARNETLAPEELESFRQSAGTLNFVMNTVGSMIGGDGKILPNFLNLPIGVLHPGTPLAEDKTTLAVDTPSTFTHLLIIGAGRTNGTGVNTDYLTYRYNRSTGANYINQDFFAVDNAITGSRATGQTKGVMGVLAQGGRPAGDVASFVAFIPFYNSSTLNKNLFSLSSPPFGAFYGEGSNWDSLDPVTEIEFSSGANDIAAGSSITVLGIG